MGLLSIFKRGNATPPVAANEPIDPVQRARVQARHRLIGAVVLVIAGIIGFPLVFETQPRPIPVDIPIELPRKDGLPPLAVPRAASPDAVPSVAAAPPPTPDDVITESRDDAGRDVVSPPVRTSDKNGTKPSTVKPESKPAARPPTIVSAETKVRSPTDAQSNAVDVARARALLEGKAVVAPTPSSAPAPGRFVVQVGAFSDAGAARETRLKVEKLGMKTYTQVASTGSGNRIRVRVGPFGSREEADRALAKARGAGLTAVLLTL